MAFESPFSLPSPSSATFSSPQSYIPSPATPSFLSGHQTMIFLPLVARHARSFYPPCPAREDRFCPCPDFGCFMSCLFTCTRFYNSSHTLMGNGMRLGRQVLYSIPSFSRPYPFLISSRIPKSGDAIQLPTQSPSPFLCNPIPIPLSRCSALIQDDDRDRAREG